MSPVPSVDILYTSYPDTDLARQGRFVTNIDDPHQAYYPFDDVVRNAIYRQPEATDALMHIGNAHWVAGPPAHIGGPDEPNFQAHLLVHADLPGAATWIKEQFQLRRHVFMIVGYIVAEQSDLVPGAAVDLPSSQMRAGWTA